MAKTTYLALYLDAPLQSWGYASKFDRRTTLAHPTRSGILGMLCAACGIDRADKAGLARLSQVDVAVYGFKLGSRLTDYHTVGGGYDAKKDAQKISPKASGASGDTVQTYREFLEGARFGVVVSGDAELIGEVGRAMQSPQWGVWLGRKSCIPASRLYAGEYGSEADALAALRETEAQRASCSVDKVSHVRSVKDAQLFAEGTETLMDIPLDFSVRAFAPRRVAVE